MSQRDCDACGRLVRDDEQVVVRWTSSTTFRPSRRFRFCLDCNDRIVARRRARNRDMMRVGKLVAVTLAIVIGAPIALSALITLVWPLFNGH